MALKKYVQGRRLAWLCIGILLLTVILLGTGLEMLRYMPFVHHRAEFDPDTGYRRIPNDRYRYASDEFDAWMDLNSIGIRGPEVSPEKPGIRIAFLGDSFTEAAQVDWPDSWPSLVCQNLDQAAECLNFGVQGYSTAQELATYVHRVRSLKPDLVIVAFYWNDWLENTQEPSSRLFKIAGDDMRLTCLPPPILLERIKWWLWNTLRPISVGRSGTPKREPVPAELSHEAQAVFAYKRWLSGVEAVKESEHPEFEAQRHIQEKIVTKLFGEISTDGAKPFALLLDGLKPWQREQIIGLADARQVSWLDLAPYALKDADEGRSWRYIYNLHYDVYGNRRVADLISPEISRALQGKPQ